MKQSLSEFLNALASGRSSGGRDHSMLAQQAVMLNRPVYAETEGTIPDYSTAAEGIAAEDLFLYPVKDFSLKKGENAWIPLFTLKLPYQHIYTWNIGDVLNEEGRYRSRSETADGKIAEEVWHACRLINKSKMPLTTAAAEFITEGAFTGQDICYYTAPGAETTIRINRAMNVLARQGEVEVERDRNAARFHGYQYDLVKMKGELKVRNRMNKPVTMEIIKELSGDVLETVPVAEDVKTAKGLKQVNPKHQLTWEIRIEPGEEVILTFQYQVYIRS
jgi:hypothetical protein